MQDIDVITENDANALGYDAGVGRGSFRHNPHDRDFDTDRHDAWQAGWIQGRQVRDEIEDGA